MPQVGYCVHCGTSTHITDVINCDHRIFAALDKIEQEQAKKAVLVKDEVPYRGFSLFCATHEGIEEWGAERDTYVITAPNLNALLHIIWLITKDNP